MLCHVTRPDSVVMEVEVDAKANGEDCLNKVSCGGIPLLLFLLLQPGHNRVKNIYVYKCSAVSLDLR